MTGRGLYPKDALIEFGDVQIDLKDAALGPDQFDHRGHQRLKRLSHPVPVMPEEDVLDRLLRDGRRPAVRPLIHRLADGGHVKAPVQAEIRILRRDGGSGHFRGDLVEGHPVLFHPAKADAFRQDVKIRGNRQETVKQDQRGIETGDGQRHPLAPKEHTLPQAARRCRNRRLGFRRSLLAAFGGCLFGHETDIATMRAQGSSPQELCLCA